MKRSLAAVFVLLLLLGTACQQQTQRGVLYYPVGKLVTEQIQYLTLRQAMVQKVALLDGAESETTFVPNDSLAWVKELDIFRTLDVINKPVNQGAYEVQDGIRDQNSNLKIKTFTTNTPLPVRFLKVYYQGNLQQVKKIESHFVEQNALYTAERYMTLEFDQYNNQQVLTRYAIRGGQKMFLGDSVHFHLRATVSIP
jgi:hypothetical protein